MLAGLPIAACAMQYEPELSDHAVMPGYSIAEVKELAGHTVRVDVYGSPFEVPQWAFAGQLAAIMNLSEAAPAHFAAHAPSDPAIRDRVVWNFAPPRVSVAPNAICRSQGAMSDRVGTPIDAYAAYCRGDEALSSVRGSLYYADSPTAPEFHQLVDAMTVQLFPTGEIGQRRSGDARLASPISHPVSR